MHSELRSSPAYRARCCNSTPWLAWAVHVRRTRPPAGAYMQRSCTAPSRQRLPPMTVPKISVFKAGAELPATAASSCPDHKGRVRARRKVAACRRTRASGSRSSPANSASPPAAASARASPAHRAAASAVTAARASAAAAAQPCSKRGKGCRSQTDGFGGPGAPCG